MFMRGAFDGIQRRPNRIKVNRDHNLERTVGKAVAFHPSRDEGLVAEVKISRTLLGDETLSLGRRGNPGRLRRVPADARRRRLEP